MLRALNVIWVALMVAGAVLTYAMKDRAGRAADHVMELRRDIAREKEAMTVLRAEWSVLDQPARLQGLVERYGDYLHLKALDVRQLASLDEVPDKPIQVPSASIDGIITSGVTKPLPVAKALSQAKPIPPARPRYTGAQP
ncbi:hypothetical protein K32_30550 [Kaistia sp. 32K]|uniref:cell division protein FtsL n=1 Tax=Kaistia sp. 32K TaxID=2795690 RepID=UPI0019154650|nr:hypothetical protein [Kaistia sp. 32K]BCP54438.1 hypothetical protein K32_30550 [Kaistia sp. 32K]